MEKTNVVELERRGKPMTERVCVKPIRPARDGIPCELCRRLAHFDVVTGQMRKDLKTYLEILRKLEAERKTEFDEHAKCSSCGILFGGLHLEKPSQDSLCSSCAKVPSVKTQMERRAGIY